MSVRVDDVRGLQETGMASVLGLGQSITDASGLADFPSLMFLDAITGYELNVMSFPRLI